jgi:cytidylate kinase
MIVAIDGPAGSGKSTTARAVAERLGFRHLESGAFYRALTVAALRAGIEPERWDELTSEALDGLRVHSRPDHISFRMFAGEEDITDELRSPEVNAHVSPIARVPAVRGWLLDQLRAAGRETDLVADGRDMQTVVFPDADLKVFLVATPETRARRRLAQQGTTEPSRAEIDAEAQRLLARDRMDSEREVGPLRRAPDAVILDTTDLDFDEQVDAIVKNDLTKYAAMVIVGGSGALVDLANNSRLHDLILGFVKLDKPIAAECYGVSCLAFARDIREKRSLLTGRRVTGHPIDYDYMDGTGFEGPHAVDGSNTGFGNGWINFGAPFYPLEYILRDAVGPRGQFIGNVGHKTSVIVDYPFITSRSTASSRECGNVLVEVLENGVRRYGW